MVPPLPAFLGSLTISLQKMWWRRRLSSLCQGLLQPVGRVLILVDVAGVIFSHIAEQHSREKCSGRGALPRA